MEKYRKRKNDVGPDELGKRLYDFILDEELEEVKLLAADPDCNVNWSNDRGWSPLMTASYDRYPDVVNVLMRRQDLMINQQASDGSTALIEASSRGTVDCVELLVDDSRTDVNLTTKKGRSALWWAYYQSINIGTDAMKLLISHGANIEGVAESVLKDMKGDGLGFLPSFEATEVMENWKLYLPEFTRVAKTNKYYPTEFKEWAFNFILCCLKSRSFPKDVIYLLLEYIARAWKN